MALSRTDLDKPRRKAGGRNIILVLLLLTVVAAAAGGGVGLYLASTVEKAFEEKERAKPKKVPGEIIYGNDARLQQLDPIVTNLASPSSTWIRLEASIVFRNGSLEAPLVTAAEVRQDLMSYLRTLPLSQFEGPSALQHLREDLNERVALRTDNRVRELVIGMIVVQ